MNVHSLIPFSFAPRKPYERLRRGTSHYTRSLVKENVSPPLVVYRSHLNGVALFCPVSTKTQLIEQVEQLTTVKNELTDEVCFS